MPGRSGSEVPPGAGPSRFERLLPFRLIAVADALQAEAPPSSAKDAFLDAWSVAEGLQPGAIATAARHHGLAMWLSTAEILFRSGVFKRYPRAHPARHLRDFSVLVVGWAAEAVPGVSGYVDLSAGRAVVPLLNGRLLLVSRGLGLAQRLRWTRTHGALLIGRDGGPVVAHIDCEEPSASRVSAPDWRIVLQEDRAGILLQGRVPDGEDSASGGTDGVELAEHAGRLLDDLRAAPRQLVTAVCRCLTYDPWRAGPEWVAGLVRLTCTDDARSLLEAAARDWVQRLLMLADVGQEFPPMDPALRSRFAALAGQTLATNLIGESRSSPRADRRAWEAVVQQMLAEPVGQGVLDVLVDRCGQDVLPAAARRAPRPSTVTLTELSGLLPQVPRLRKSRHGALSSVDDWSAINALLDCPEPNLRSVYQALRDREPCRALESQSFALAICAYVLGEFAVARTALLNCLRIDADVEEYWHLLAFTCRHLRAMDEFNGIVFGGRRDVLASDSDYAAAETDARLADHGRASTGPAEGSPDWQGAFRDLVAVRGSALQLPQYAAVLTEIRRSMDDWIPIRQFEAYEALLARLGLCLRVDCAFLPLSGQEQPLGIEYAPTTRARGSDPASIKDPRASLHVIVSRRPSWADETLANSWYAVVVDGRVLTKPKIDHLRLGLAFGYPECCVRSFIQYNRWGQMCNLTEAANNSRRTRWEANCLTKNTPWMTIFHIPCAFDCPATVDYSQAVLAAVAGIDLGYASKLEAFIKQTVLVVNEKLSYALVGAVSAGDDRVRYEEAIDLCANLSFREPSDDDRTRALRSANELLVTGDSIVLFRDGAVCDVLELRCDGGVVENPLLLHFE